MKKKSPKFSLVENDLYYYRHPEMFRATLDDEDNLNIEFKEDETIGKNQQYKLKK